jgi:hypothetical protein
VTNDTNFLDYTIEFTPTGYYLLKNGNNAMADDVKFKDLDLLKKSAILLFMMHRPQKFQKSLYQRLMGLSGCKHEWFILKEVLTEEKIQMPQELEFPISGSGFMIGYNLQII